MVLKYIKFLVISWKEYDSKLIKAELRLEYRSAFSWMRFMSKYDKFKTHCKPFVLEVEPPVSLYIVSPSTDELLKKIPVTLSEDMLTTMLKLKVIEGVCMSTAKDINIGRL